MKKILAILIISLLLSGCSANNNNKESSNNSGVPAGPSTEIKNKNTTTQESLPQATETQLPVDEKGWFIGAIGSAKIHAKLDITEMSVSGVYYYDKYKTNINIEGNVGNELKDVKTISLTEDTENAGEFYGIFKTQDYIEGYWKEGDKIFPMYLIKSDSDINPPSQPDKEAKIFDGDWMGEKSSYFVGSFANVKVLFKDLLYFDLESHNGAHTGCLTGLAVISQGKAVTRFFDEFDGDVFYDFSINDGKLHIDSNKYDYMCGAGVSNMTDYVKGGFDIPVPGAKEVGIVDTREQAEKFKSLVGDRYEDFISLTQATNSQDFVLDGKNVSVRNSYLMGLPNECIYIISKEHIYAAIVAADGIEYYTNDKSYSNKLPGPILEWTREKMDLEVHFNYRE